MGRRGGCTLACMPSDVGKTLTSNNVGGRLEAGRRHPKQQQLQQQRCSRNTTVHRRCMPARFQPGWKLDMHGAVRRRTMGARRSQISQRQRGLLQTRQSDPRPSPTAPRLPKLEGPSALTVAIRYIACLLDCTSARPHVRRSVPAGSFQQIRPVCMCTCMSIGLVCLVCIVVLDRDLLNMLDSTLADSSFFIAPSSSAMSGCALNARK